MRTLQLGAAGPTASVFGLGCMGMSDFYGPADRGESIATLHAALDAGITLLDTGDFYGMGHNELLIAEALKGRDRDKVLLSVKFGAQRAPDSSWIGFDARPSAVKTALAYTLRRLNVDHIDIYRPARLDPAVAIEDTVGAIAELIKAGYVRYLGLSEVGAETIRRAHAVHPVADLQIEYAILTRGVEDAIIPTLDELGIGMTAYGVLSRGLLSGAALKGESMGGYRAFLPRFAGENRDANLKLVAALEEIARAKNATVTQLAIAWVAARGPWIMPLIGARRRDRLAEALGALDITLSAEDMARIEAAAPRGSTLGARYPEPQMAMLDSERRG